MQANTPSHTYDLAHSHDHHHEAAGNKLFGFWVYLMSDCVLFATLFATYAVLESGSIAGPTGKDIFELPFVFVETMMLLFSSITFGFGMIAMKRKDVLGLKRWIKVTFVLGLAFICMEVYEFHHLIAGGYGPQESAFLSAFFTLVGTRLARNVRSDLDGGGVSPAFNQRIERQHVDAFPVFKLVLALP